MKDQIQQEREQFFRLLKAKAFFREKIILSSGKESDYYIDARRATLTSEGAYLSASLMLAKIAPESFAAIGGPTLGADPIIGAIGVLCHQIKRPMNTFIIRKAPKAHGKQQQIEGPLIPAGSKVVLIDDVATTGKAFLESLDVLEKHNVQAPQALCIVDRKEGAKEALARRGCELVSIFTAEEFLN